MNAVMDKKAAKEAEKRAKASAKQNKPGKQNKKGKKEKKKGKTFVLVLILLIVLLLMVTCACAYFMFGAGNAEYTLSVIKSGRTYKDVTDAELVQQRQKLDEDQSVLETKKTDLEQKQKDLTALEEKLKKRQAELDDQASPNLLDETATEEETQQLILIYEKMDASKAADIFNKINDVGKISKLLTGMKQTAASKILQAMDPALAATVTKNVMARDAIATPTPMPTITPKK